MDVMSEPPAKLTAAFYMPDSGNPSHATRCRYVMLTQRWSSTVNNALRP
ncbi:hypothetical protein L581_3944 [Serratia fonticola AU-AP2C]|nr:hypothetical protein L581_3944 [Serratia fonticola AU-AP2C]